MSTLEESPFPRSTAPELPWVLGPEETSEMEPPSSFSQNGPPALASRMAQEFPGLLPETKRLHTWSFLPREGQVPCLPVTRRCVALGDVLGEQPPSLGSPGRESTLSPREQASWLCGSGKPVSSCSQRGEGAGGCPLASPLHFTYKTSAANTG